MRYYWQKTQGGGFGWDIVRLSPGRPIVMFLPHDTPTHVLADIVCTLQTETLEACGKMPD